MKGLKLGGDGTAHPTKLFSIGEGQIISVLKAILITQVYLVLDDLTIKSLNMIVMQFVSILAVCFFVFNLGLFVHTLKNLHGPPLHQQAGLRRQLLPISLEVINRWMIRCKSVYFQIYLGLSSTDVKGIFVV